jgi:hypothetical protein
MRLALAIAAWVVAVVCIGALAFGVWPRHTGDLLVCGLLFAVASQLLCPEPEG